MFSIIWYKFYFNNIIIIFFFKLKIINLLITNVTIVLAVIPFELLLFLSFSLIIIGLWSACINQNNLFKTILSLEITYLGISLLFITVGLINLDLKCFIIALILFSVGAAETVLILSLLIALFTFNRSIKIESLNNLL